MIAVARTQEPGVLRRNERKWLTKLRCATTPSKKKNAVEKYRRPEIRHALASMFHGKCAYCESKIRHIDYFKIEHYRPKATFPDLTFAWDNLMLSCNVCNSAEYKGTRFPEAADGGPYVNPCKDDPAEHFRFVYDPRTKLASVYGKTRRGTTTERDLGLNRPDLRSRRSKYVERLACLARLAKTDPEAQRLLAEARQADAEYSAFAVHCL
jgi:uncharacterized protein (TIGR02646 family)